jgi:hypothetical protein
MAWGPAYAFEFPSVRAQPVAKQSLCRFVAARHLSEEEEAAIYRGTSPAEESLNTSDLASDRGAHFLKLSRSPFIKSDEHGQELLQPERAPTWLDLFLE